MSAPASALQDTGESIAPYVLVAVLAHAGMLCCLVLVEALYALFAPEFKPIDPDTFIEITAGRRNRLILAQSRGDVECVR
jgi:hypothetical protein